MHYLTRRFSFSSAHRLQAAGCSAAENRARYGACHQLHGHNYELVVTVRGTVDPALGFCCNVLDLARLVEEVVVAPCDHRQLEEVALFADLPATTMENMVTRIWQVLDGRIAELGVELYEVQVAESNASSVSLRRDAGN